MNDCVTETVNLALIAFTAAMVTGQQILSFYRHKHIMSDNKRLLHVIEDKTETVQDVK